MPEPISEQITAAAVTTMRGITRTDGYPVTAQVRRYDERGNNAGEPNTDVLIEVEANAPVWMPSIAPLTKDGYEMNINFICYPKSAESTGTAADTLLHRAYASIYKAWCADYAFGGLAYNSELNKPVEGQRGTTLVTIIPCRVWFYTDQGDPFTQT